MDGVASEIVAAAIPTDVSDEAAVDRLISGAVDRFGRLGAAFNNAGVTAYSPIDQLTADDFDRVMATNVLGVWLLIKAEVETLRRQGQGGVIVNTSSVAATGGSVGLSVYAASKGALDAMIRAVALEVGGDSSRHRRRHALRTGIWPGSASARPWPRRDPGCRRCGHGRRAADHRCRSGCGACGPISSCSHSSPGHLPLICSSDGLAVQDGCGGRRLSTDARPIRHHQRVVDPLPHTLPLPATQVIIHRLPGRQIMGQQALGRARSQKVEDRVDQLPRRCFARASAGLRLRDQRRYADDITFSSYQRPMSLFETAVPGVGLFSPDALAAQLRVAITSNGFVVNPNKAHYADRNSRWIVTGER